MEGPLRKTSQIQRTVWTRQRDSSEQRLGTSWKLGGQPAEEAQKGQANTTTIRTAKRSGHRVGPISLLQSRAPCELSHVNYIFVMP